MSGQSYKELAIPFFKEVFDGIDEVLTKLKVPYYLIGVNAMALELLKKGVKPSRATKDIDFAIMLSSLNEFEQVVKALEVKGFTKAQAPWTLYHEGFDTAIDLLPFGEIEEKDTLGFTERHTDLHVLGLKEVLAETKEVMIEDKLVQVPPLPGMVLLKLVAWSDRPKDRENDQQDILLIIRHYYDYQWDEIVELHHDLFPEEGAIDEMLVAARVLGRKAAETMNRSERLKERIMQVLEDNIDTIDKTPIAQDWAHKLDSTVVYAQRLLSELRAGLQEGIQT